MFFFLIYSLEFLSFDKLDLSDDESDDDGSGLGSPVTYTLPFCSGKFVGCVDDCVGRVCGMGFDVFVPTGIESISDVVLLVVFVPR